VWTHPECTPLQVWQWLRYFVVIGYWLPPDRHRIQDRRVSGIHANRNGLRFDRHKLRSLPLKRLSEAGGERYIDPRYLSTGDLEPAIADGYVDNRFPAPIPVTNKQRKFLTADSSRPGRLSQFRRAAMCGELPERELSTDIICQN
jgi:hypothetical protein